MAGVMMSDASELEPIHGESSLSAFHHHMQALLVRGRGHMFAAKFDNRKK
jgi:hypothetical protein